MRDAPGNGKEALARYEHPRQELALTAAFDVDTAKKRHEELQKFVEYYLVPDEDYGIIPGTKKPTLLKSGADKLCDIYLLADEYAIISKVEDWDKNLFDYTIECRLTSKRNGQLVSSGLGSCSSFEKKYRWRETKRKCLRCDKETIIKGKAEFSRGKPGFENGGWVCWKKEGKSDGCGAQFADSEPGIVNQIVGRVENEDIPDLKNTILKMSKKRAKIDAVLGATRSSGLFTQDMEDMPTGANSDGRPQAAEPAQPAQAAQSAKQPEPAKAATTPPAKQTAQKPKQEAAKPPKAEIPKDLPGGPVEKAVPPKTSEAKEPIKPPPSRRERLSQISSVSGTSGEHMMAFLFKHLNCTPDTLRAIEGKRLDGTIKALEMTLGKFTGKEVRPFLADEQGYEERVKNYFLAIYADTQR